jgi:hypothetical protein
VIDADASETTTGHLDRLLYELLDAHVDTITLAADLTDTDTDRWAAHLDYLRDLQRVGHETLARMA